MASLHNKFSNDKQEHFGRQNYYHNDYIQKVLPAVCSLINYKKTFILKAFITPIAFKRLLTTVISLMNDKTMFIGKTFLTIITFKKCLTTVSSLTSEKTKHLSH